MSISDFPSTQLEQDIICKRHYNLTLDELLPEEACRGSAVQRELNMVDIGNSVAGTIGGALVALPLGILADRIGRVPVLALSLLSLFLSEGYTLLIYLNWKTVPLRAMWASGGILLLGGGRGVAEAMVFATISDAMPESKRATCFQWAVGAVLSAQLFGPLLAARLLDISIWHPLYIELAFIALGGLALTFFLPETLPEKSAQQPILSERHPLTSPSPPPPPSTRETLKTLFRRPALYFLPGAVLAIPSATAQNDIILRLMPVQFGWSFQRSSLLMSLSAGVTLITLLLILPGLSYAIHKRTPWQPLKRDRILAYVSAFFVLFGSFFLMMVSKKALVIFGLVNVALGSGVPTLCRTMIVALGGKQATGVIFGIIAAGEILGLLVCETVVGVLFDAGLDSWMGLPFCLGMGISLAIGISTWLVPPLKTIEDDEDARSDSVTAIISQDVP
ncbi:Efflux pump ustT-like protein [Cladobotryum mycophilum]|uniref:Efflux pump ustT-like protein n=1 Tax=Cladobotryum mycophilum TaxID=491253 RepID=A0ABR0S5N7_9HYPO